MKKGVVRYGGTQARIFYEKTVPTQWAIVLSGFPPGNPPSPYHPTMIEIIDRGWGVIAPEYPGVRDSNGSFSPSGALSCVKRTIDFLKKGSCVELWSQETLKWDVNKIVLVGISFGGSVALVSAVKYGVQRVIAVAPVVDWKKELGETDTALERMTRRVYPKTVRLSQEWKKWKVVNPASHVRKLLQYKVWLVHAADDPIVPVEQSVWLQEKIGCKLAMYEDGGHLSFADIPEAVLNEVFGRKNFAPWKK